VYYVAHRLFAAHDRALGAHIASRLAHEVGAGNVFLPFCDTDEENLVSDCKGRLLFDLDCTRLRGISGMIALLHGPSLDDGVCMEIGFAAALGVPVVAVSSDFQVYSAGPGAPAFTFPDPLLDHVTTLVIRVHRLGPQRRPSGENRFRVFLGQNMNPIREAARQAASAVLRPVRRPPEHRISPDTDLAYIEPSPYINDPMWAVIASELDSRGWRVHTARRFQPGHGQADDARADWAAARTAAVAVVDARGPETPPGAALIIGARRAAGCPVLAAHPGNWQTLADGREPNWRNLMIQYAVTGRFAEVAGFTAALDRLPCLPT
jgi:Nucleoside 2-deoxyribosyltransferase